MRTLVIGGTGFLGSNVTRALLDRGHEVTVLKRESSDLAALDGVESRVKFATGDLRDRASLVAAMRGHEWVVHAAGFYPVTSLDEDAALARGVSDMRTVLSAAREARVDRLAYTSTLTTIGRSPDAKRMADERDLYVPGSIRSTYCEVKWAMEQEMYRAIARGLDGVVLCPTIVIGEWDAKPTSGRLVTAVASGKLPLFLEGQLNIVHARDVGLGHALALEKGETGERYILGGDNMWAREFFAMVAKEAGVPPPTFEVPYRMARAASLATEAAAVAGASVASRVKSLRHLRKPPALPLEAVEVLHAGRMLDCSKARDELGVPHTPARDAVRDALAWFRARGYC